MKNYKKYFKGKKITIMGLGLLGGALNDAIFLAECGAKLTITDLKSSNELAPSLNKLTKFKKIKYVLGEHKLEDFRDKDYILQPGNVPPDSPYLLEARKNNIPIHESESLFFQYLPKKIKTIGITGTRGKTTTTRIIYKILNAVYGRKIYLAGNTQGKSTLVLLKVIKPGDTVVLELDSWCLHGMGEINLPTQTGKSPNVAVFTNFMSDHLNFYLRGSKNEKEALDKYFQDKAQIYLHQNKNDYLICGERIARKIRKTKSKKIIARASDIPKSWKIKIPGEHNLENIACAIKAVDAFFKLTTSLNTPWRICKKVVENFTGVEGRLELLRNYKGIKIYNDTTATTPDATVMALRALGSNPPSRARFGEARKKIVLIVGGADKGLDMSGLIKEIPKYCKSVIVLPGTGTEKLGISNIEYGIWNKLDIRHSTFDIQAILANNLQVAIECAMEKAKQGDIVLFSPAFASFGMFKNEYDRGEQFVKIIKGLK